MTATSRAWLLTSMFAFLASMVGLCLCVEHVKLWSLGLGAHDSDHEESESHHDGDSHHDPVERESSDGHCGGDCPEPAGPCCCSVNSHQLAVQTSITPLAIDLKADSQSPYQLFAALRAPNPDPEVKHPPPPDEGFKLWPDVALFVQHSSLQI